MVIENIYEDNGAPKNRVSDSGAATPIADEPPESEPISEADFNAYIALIPPDNGVPVKEYDWKADLIKVKRKNKETGQLFEAVESSSQHNIYLMTRYSERLRGIFILNEFSRRKMVVRCPPWEKPNRFRPRDVRDDDYSRICMELELMGMMPSKERAAAAIESICHDRSFHPVQRYFKSLKWDGKKRLHTWLAYYLGATTDPENYLSAIGTKWLVAAVARIFEPGCKFDHMLVLEGGTDIGKSAALRRMATFHGEDYFYDGMTFANIGDKDTMQNIQGSLIIEFPELSSLQSREVDDIKQWITIQEDRGRKPYGREPVIYPRQFVLAGTTNNSEYLKDATGNKRFWPVRCGPALDLNALETDKGQLWAEAVSLYHGGHKWWIGDDDSLIQEAKEVQRKRMVIHPWEEAVLEYIHGKNFVSCTEILLKKIEKPLERIKRNDEMAVADILKMNGFIPGREGSRRGWSRQQVQLELGRK